MRVVCDEAVLGAAEAFTHHDNVELLLCPAHHLNADLIAKADAVIIRSTCRVDEELLKNGAPRYLATATVGSDHVDLPLLESRGCHFASAQGSSADSVAQFTWATLLQLKDPWQELKLGVVGCGAIGERVARIGEALALDVVRIDPFLDGEQYGALSDLQTRNALTFHVPLTKTGPHPTYHMVNEAWLRHLPRGCILVNTARGPIVEENAIKAARRNGHLGPIALDVFPKEPAWSPALVDACELVTPHIAGRSLDGMRANTQAICDSFRSFFNLPKKTIWKMETARPVEAGANLELKNLGNQVWDLGRFDRTMRAAAKEDQETRAKIFRTLRQPPYRRDLTSLSFETQGNQDLQRFVDALQIEDF